MNHQIALMKARNAKRDQERKERERRNEDKRETPQDQSSQSGKAAGAVLVRGSGANSTASATQYVAANAAKQTTATVTQAVKNVIAQQQQISAIGAATATVNAAISAGMAASAAFAPIATALTGVMTTIGPFAVLSVAAVFGFNSIADVTAEVAGLTESRAAEIAAIINDLVATNTLSEAAIYTKPSAIADLISARLDSTPARYVPPFGLRIDGSDLSENGGRDTVGDLHGNAGGDGGLQWSIVSGEGFTLDGNRLVAIRGFDFEAQQSAKLVIKATNHAGFSTEIEVIVVILNVNEAPSIQVESDFVNGQLVITFTGTDPDGDLVSLPGPFTYTLAELAAGSPSFAVVGYDQSGLASEPVTVNPPDLGAAAALDNPQPPIILSAFPATIVENQVGSLIVTAYDAIDGIITSLVPIPKQNYEADQTAEIPYAITNSNGISTQGTASVTVLDVLEGPMNGDFSDGLNHWTINHGGAGISGYTHSIAVTNGAADLTMTGTVGAYGTGFGPSLTSSQFDIEAGSRLTFDWTAANGGDDAVIRVVLTEAGTGQQTTVLYHVGNGAGHINVPVLDSGVHSLTVAAGSYDASGGTYIGSHITLDNVQVG